MKTFLNLFWCITVMAAISSVYAQKEESALDSLKQKVGILQQQLEELKNRSTAMEAVESSQLSTVNDSGTADSLLQNQIQELNDNGNSISEVQKKVLPNVFNPSIGLVGELITSYTDKGSAETGNDQPGGIDFFARSTELDIAASVDPFAKGYAVLNASADPFTGEAALGVEEAAILTTSLPWNLELKAGRFFAEFGRLSYVHDHELPFVNRPLVLDNYVGGESRSDGLQLNFLFPFMQYISLTAGAGNQFGGDPPNPNNPGDFRRFNELNYWGRLSTYFDLSADWQLEIGLSGEWNPSTVDRGGALVQPDGDTLTEKERRIVDVDLSLRWVPLRNNQFRSLTWGTEVLFNDNRFLVSSDSEKNSVPAIGLYSYLTWKFSRALSAGFLLDWVEDYQNASERTIAYSPYITWALTHWNMLRLQYTRTENDPATGLENNDAVYLQWAWIIGSHSHGWQQR